MLQLETIARIQSDFQTKFGIPRQSNLVKGLKATIVFEEAFRNPDVIRGLEDFSHCWLIWGFSENMAKNWSPTVRPPRLGGNERRGVFATRSPFRPNPLGLSSLPIDSIELHPTLGPLIHVLGADLMDGTPIYDIKPYIPYADAHADAVGGFARQAPDNKLQVLVPEALRHALPAAVWPVVEELLSLDPRPAYQEDPSRIYGMLFRGYELRFSVEEKVLTLREVIPDGEEKD